MAAKASGPRVLYWHRTDLRLHDSPALQAALDLKPAAFYPIWCWDSHYVYRTRVGPNRFQFLIDCQDDLSASYTKLNSKQKLWVLREPAVTLLPKLWKTWKITHLVFERDTDAYAAERDAKIMELAGEAGVEVVTRMGRTLWDPVKVVEANGGKPTMSLGQLQKAGEKVGEIARPLNAPTSIPDPGDTKLDGLEQLVPDRETDLNGHLREGEEGSYTVGIAGPNGDFAVPTLKDLGLPEATTPHKGGETLILERLEEILKDEGYCATFEKPKTSPAAFEPQATFLTSPALHFGALSVRYFYWRVQDIVDRRRTEKKSHSEPPTSLSGQLLFRDMYFAAQSATGWPFGQTYANPHVRFVPWHLPSTVDVASKRTTGGHEIDDSEKEIWFQRWAEGRTGFPWIDAIMRQLRSEGWIHHLARHSVACFLTRGGAYISWERGAEVFEELLLDHEVACNSGNWQWLSCTAFFAQFYRCYSPVAFGKKWDPEGEYVRRYVPELRAFPKKWIYEPHKAPIQDQKRAGVRVDGDGTEKERDGLRLYPKPMFDFARQRDICIQGLKTAYAAGLYGDDPKVMNGSWKQALDVAGAGLTEGKEGGPGGLDTFEDAEHEGEDEGAHTPPRGVEREVGSHGSPTKRTPKKGGISKGTPAKATPSKAGHKREASQSTLDGMMHKAKKK